MRRQAKPGERDYPLNHPSAPDFDGSPYTPPKSPYAVDYPDGHPAQLGKNCKPEDQPDWKH